MNKITLPFRKIAIDLINLITSLIFEILRERRRQCRAQGAIQTSRLWQWGLGGEKILETFFDKIRGNCRKVKFYKK